MFLIMNICRTVRIYRVGSLLKFFLPIRIINVLKLKINCNNEIFHLRFCISASSSFVESSKFHIREVLGAQKSMQLFPVTVLIMRRREHTKCSSNREDRERITVVLIMCNAHGKNQISAMRRLGEERNVN